MSDRTCIKCNKIFDAPCRLKAHLKRKKTCELFILTNIDNKLTDIDNKFKCKFCNKSFVTNISMYRHIRLYCKIGLTGANKQEIIQLKFQNQINQLTNTVNNLLQKENTIIQKENTIIQKENTIIQNVETQNNIQNNNNITINCTILPYPDMNIKHDDILNPFLKGNSAANEYAKIPYLEKVDIKNSEVNNQLISSTIIEMIENIYADSENRNIYLLKKDKVMVYQNNGIWCIKSLDNVNRELCGNVVQNVKAMRDKIIYPKEIYNGEKNAINETFRDLPSEYENNTSKILKNSKNELSIILESNKDKLKNDKLI